MILNKLEKTMTIEHNGKKYEATLFNKTEPRGGVGCLKNIKWYTYTLNEPILEYDAVMLMFFKIDSEGYNTSKQCLEYGKVSENTMPHIDGNTGNIHPGYCYVERESGDYDKVNQLILCKSKKNKKKGTHPGPNIDYGEEEYLYPVVHKSSYFPLIEKTNENLKNNERYKFLKAFACELHNKLDDKNILSKEILKEIK